MFPTHTSIFTNEALEQQVLARYDLPQPVRCAFFRQGLNDTYLVETAVTNRPEGFDYQDITSHSQQSPLGLSFYLRIYRHKWRTQAQIEAEIAILNECAQAGLPVSTPMAQRDGRYLTAIPAAEGTRCAVLFTTAPGQQHINPTAEQSHVFGQLTGQMHNLFDELPARYERFEMDEVYFGKRPFHTIQRIFGHHSHEMQVLSHAAQTLSSPLSPLPTMTMASVMATCTLATSIL